MTSHGPVCAKTHLINHYYQDSKTLFLKTRAPFLQFAMPQKCYADFALYSPLTEVRNQRFPDSWRIKWTCLHNNFL